VPELSRLIANGETDEVRNMEPGELNMNVIQNTVTINRGRVRARNVVTWDEGGFPLQGAAGRTGLVPASHALLNFVGSTVQGHVASEFVVDIPDATGVRLKTSPEPTSERRKAKLSARKDRTLEFNNLVRYGDVEILITNYEFQRDTAVPWGLDFQWLFEALGYGTVDLANAGFDRFRDFAVAYNAELFEREVEMLLEPTVDGPKAPTEAFTRGRPFPYIASHERLAGLSRLKPTDEESRPICIGGFQSGGR